MFVGVGFVYDEMCVHVYVYIREPNSCLSTKK